MNRTQRLLCVAIGAMLSVFVGYVTDTYVHPRPAKAAPSTFAVIACDQTVPVSIAANTQIITAGNANMFIYICSYNVNAVAADVFSIVEGTGTTCATNTKAVVGATTAAAGLSLAATGSINYGGGTGFVARTVVAGDNVCILVTTAGPLSGVVGWTSAPY